MKLYLTAALCGREIGAKRVTLKVTKKQREREKRREERMEPRQLASGARRITLVRV